MLFLVKYLFISEINANIRNPLKSLFEALNYYTGLKASCAKTDSSTVFKTSQPSFTTSKYLLINICLCIQNNLISKAYNLLR